MKTLEEALALFDKHKGATSASVTDIAERYDTVSKEILSSIKAQTFLRTLADRVAAEDTPTVFNTVFVYGVIIGMEMEKSENIR